MAAGARRTRYCWRGMDTTSRCGGRSADHVAEIVRTHRNDLYLPGVEMPIAETVYRVCHEGLHVADAIAALMNRGLKSE